jgi:predicted tellurium resistance membrane protein TerC
LADLAFAIDSILAAVALAIALPDSPLPAFGGMDGAKFAVIVIAGIAGLVLIKYAATWFVKLLNDKPGLETTAYLIVAWVGVKLAVITLAHDEVGVLPHEFPHGLAWTVIFWGVLLSTAVGGWFLSGKSKKDEEVKEHSAS